MDDSVEPERLGPYKIEGRLGRGGMGTVYLARDTRLGRAVAVKVLAAHADKTAPTRFLREARTVAALQHPNFAVLHNVGETGETSYLVMERVEGHTLQTMLVQGALAWPDALRYGEQLASALAHAHGHGVLHRDIKPGNIMISPERGAVLLDFGLAQRGHFPAPSVEAADTESVGRLTRDGATVGTSTYMSPEQLRDDDLDVRSDLFQLGMCLYQAVAGRHPFSGPTSVDMMHAILRNEPTPLGDVTAIPQELSRIVGKLLEKEPAYRYPSSAALHVDLRGLERSSETGTAALTSGQRRQFRRPRLGRIALGAGLVGAFAAAFYGWGRLSRPEPPPSARPARIVPLMAGPGSIEDPSFSPDGNSVVFASDRDGNWDLWYGRIGGGNAIRITDTPEVEAQPDWSPDGARVAFTRQSVGGTSTNIFVMPALGGPARRLVAKALDPSWSPDGSPLAFAVAGGGGGGWMNLARVSVDAGGEAEPITSLESGFFHRRPSWTPDGATIVFNRSPGGTAGQIMRVPSQGGEATPLTRDPTGTTNLSAVVTHDGRFVVHVSDRGGAVNLWRIGIAGGAPEPITSGPGRDMSPAATMDGRRIAFVSSPVATSLVSIAPSTATAKTIASFDGNEAWAPGLSPDEELLVLADKAPGSRWRLTLVERETGSRRRLLEGLPDLFWGRFTPDGASLVFHSRGDQDGSRIGRIGVDGTGLTWLTAAGDNTRYPDVSSDGRLVFVRGGESAPQIVSRPLVGDGEETVLVTDATLPVFSPDGRSIALPSGRSFGGGIGVVDASGGEVRWLTTSGTWPTWMPGGREIAFADAGPEGSQAAFTVPIGGGDAKPLTSYTWDGSHWPFVVAASGEIITTDWAGARKTLWLAEF